MATAPERAPALRPQRVPERRRPRAGARRRAVTAVQLQLRVLYRQQLNGLRLQLNGPRRQIVAGCGRWPAAWRGVAPAGSVHAVGMNGTLHDGAEQARAVPVPAEAPPSSWMPTDEAAIERSRPSAMSCEASAPEPWWLMTAGQERASLPRHSRTTRASSAPSPSWTAALGRATSERRIEPSAPEPDAQEGRSRARPVQPFLS